MLFVGTVLGYSDGLVVGMFVGEELGISVGDMDDVGRTVIVGSPVGAWDGEEVVGDTDGTIDGVVDGLIVGEYDGWEVGLLEGIFVGLWDG